MSWLDLAIIVVVVLGALIGLWRGFFKSVISLFGWLVSFIIAFFITKPIVGALLDAEKVKNFVVGSGSGWSLYNWIYRSLPDLSSGFWSKLLKSLINVATDMAASGNGDVNTNVALMLANGVFSVIVCLGILIVIRFLLLLFTMFANAMTKDKLAGAANRLFGLLIGAVKGFGFVCVMMVFMTFLMGVGFMAPVREQLDKSVIGAPLYKQISRATDSVISGGKNRLETLLRIWARGNENTGGDEENNGGDTEEKPYAGEYSATEQSGENKVKTYKLELKADGTFALQIAIDGIVDADSTRNGNYAVNGENVMLNFSDGDEDTILLGDGWLYMWEMFFTKPGVTPPAQIENGDEEQTPPTPETSARLAFAF